MTAFALRMLLLYPKSIVWCKSKVRNEFHIWKSFSEGEVTEFCKKEVGQVYQGFVHMKIENMLLNGESLLNL